MHFQESHSFTHLLIYLFQYESYVRPYVIPRFLPQNSCTRDQYAVYSVTKYNRFYGIILVFLVND